MFKKYKEVIDHLINEDINNEDFNCYCMVSGLSLLKLNKNNC